MVMRERFTKFIVLLAVLALVASVQAQTPTSTASQSGYIIVGLYPHADFSADPVFGSVPLVVAFTDRSSGSTPRAYQWDFGDGGTSTAMNPTHTYTAAGVYTVTLTITNAYASDKMEKAGYIRVGIAPLADFAASPLSGNLPLSVAFTDMSTGNPTTWSWDFGDGVTSTQQNPSHTYTLAGIYTVSLTVTNAYGTATKVKTGFISTGMPPAADLSATPQAGAIPLTVKFTDTSKGGPTAWSWDFGDGSSSTDRNPTHIYMRVGVYTVSLTASNAYGTRTSTKPAFISAGAVPVSDFSSDVRTVKVPGVVNFVDRSQNGPTSWSWSFGDGSTSSAMNPNHTYTTPGIYAVSLTVANSYGSDTESKPAYINAGIGPTADFGADMAVFAVPHLVQFADRSTGNPTSWSWNFGDGTHSTDRNPYHNYATPGSYTVSLTVANAFGTDTATKTGFINAGGAPVADFGASPTAVMVPGSVQFTDMSTGNPTTWSWDLGDGSASSQKNPVHVYTVAGTYTVSLTVRNGYGADKKTKAAFINAGARPKADFTADERVGTAPFTVQFTDLSTGNPTTWSWDFGDGGTSTEQNPSHVYKNEGAYDVTLTVTNAFGTSTEKKTGTMAPGATGVTTPKATPTAAATLRTTVSSSTPATAAPTTVAPPETPMSGFEGALAVSGLAALVYLAKRQK
jgi:PKD repeat protein